MEEVLQKLPQALLGWYDANRRDLPWRHTKDPYRIWLSEVMLQQTRVEAVKGYYARFLATCPDIAALAGTGDEQINKLWEGLGYYSRARNLKKAAVRILQEHGGVFPRRYEDIRALPGIGDYTAGAIASIAFNRKKAAVDGNVMRLVSRLLCDPTPIDEPKFRKAVAAALERVYPDRAGDFTQALMELGATLCGPNTAPRCGECPCSGFCRGHLSGRAESLPVKKPRAARHREDRTVFILRCGGLAALHRRQDTGLLAGLWEFPNTAGRLSLEAAIAKVEEMGLKVTGVYKQVERKHIFTHIIWQMCGYYLEVAEPGGAFTWLQAEQVAAQAALPTAFRQFWEEEDHV